jgi:hypothetical protein
MQTGVLRVLNENMRNYSEITNIINIGWSEEITDENEFERNRLNPRRDIIFVPQVADNTPKESLGCGSNFSSLSGASAPLYSDHQCRGNPDDTVLPLYTQRTCLLRNVYLDPSTGILHYFASPFYSNVTDVAEEIATAVGYIHKNIIMDRERIKRLLYDEKLLRYHPIVHVGTEPPAQISSIPVMSMNHENTNSNAQPQIPVVLLYMWSYSFNFGHSMWDDAFSLHAMLDTFGLWNDVEPKRTYRHVPVMMNNPGYYDPFFAVHRPRRLGDTIRMSVGKNVLPA